MVIDHSAGSPFLNDMIDRDLIAGTKMDGMHLFIPLEALFSSSEDLTHLKK